MYNIIYYILYIVLHIIVLVSKYRCLDASPLRHSHTCDKI